MSKKVKTNRAEAVARFTKSLAALEETPSQQELAQKKKAERERVERERVAKLSAEEQRKYIEKEKARATKSIPPAPQVKLLAPRVYGDADSGRKSKNAKSIVFVFPY